MADTYKILGQVLTGDIALDNLTVKETVAYEVPSNTQTSISAIEITNSDIIDQTYKISLVKNIEKSSAVLDLDYNKAYSAGIPIPELYIQDISVPEQQTLEKVVYGNGIFLSMGYYIRSSVDGINWTSTVSPIPTSNWTQIIYTGSFFIAVSQDGYIAYSQNGITWGYQYVGYTLTTVSYGSNKIVVGGSGIYGYANVNPNLTFAWNWTGYSNLIVSSAYGNNVFSMSTNNGKFLVSSDAISWSEFSPSVFLTKMIYADNKFIGIYNDKIFYSYNGSSWTETTNPISSMLCRDVAYANGIFVIVDYSRTLYSYDGIVWNASDLSNASSRVVYGNQKFIAYGEWSSNIAYSNDGVVWSAKILPGYQKAIQANGKYFAVNGQYGLAYSIDGVDWNFKTLKYPYQNISYGNGIFTLVGQYLPYAYSYDGFNWIYKDSDVPNNYVYGNGIYVAPSGFNEVKYSYNGIDWYTKKVFRDGQKIVYGNGIFISTGNSYSVYYSYDGLLWNHILSPDGIVSDIVFANGMFVGVKRYGTNNFIYSNNGITWTLSSNLNANYGSIEYGNGRFVAIGSYGNYLIAYSLDGLNWNVQSHNHGDISYGIKYFNNVFYVYSGNGLLTTSDGISLQRIDYMSTYSIAYANGVFVRNGNYDILYSYNGVNWITVPIDYTVYGSAYTPNISYVNDRFIARLNSDPSKVFESYDGVSWTKNFFGYNNKIVFGNNKFIVSSTYPNYNTKFYYSSNGLEWNAVSNTSDGIISYGNGMFVSSSANGPTKKYSYDGITWTELSYPGNNTSIVYFIGNKFITLYSDWSTYKTLIAVSTDGINWTSSEISGIYYGQAYIEDVFIIIGMSNSAYSYDTTTWTVFDYTPHSNISLITTHTQQIPQSLNKHWIIYNKTILSGETHEIKGGIVLSAGDQIRAYSSSNEVIVNVYGVELS